jgi:hypothetical protein
MAFDGPCLIRRAGITPDGKVQLDLKAADGKSFDWNWFLGKPELTREMLAIALAAITSEKQVFVQMADPKIMWSEVYRFGLIK